MPQVCNPSIPEVKVGILEHSQIHSESKAREGNTTLSQKHQYINKYRTVFEGTEKYLCIRVCFKLCSTSHGLVKGVHEAKIFLVQFMAFHNNAPCEKNQSFLSSTACWQYIVLSSDYPGILRASTNKWKEGQGEVLATVFGQRKQKEVRLAVVV